MFPTARAALGDLAAAAPSPDKKGPLDIYQRPKVQGLLAILAAHPEASAALKDSLLQATLAPIQAQQAQAQENRQGASALATNYFSTPGATQEGLQGLISANYPNLADKPFGQNLLEGLGSTLPGGVDDGTLSEEDAVGVTNSVAEAYSTLDPKSETYSDQLNAIVDGIRNKAIANNKTEEGVQAAVQLAQETIQKLLKGGGGEPYTTSGSSSAPPPGNLPAPTSGYTRYGGRVK